MKSITSNSLGDTEKIAEEFVQRIGSNRDISTGAFIVGLSGHLGAGKTAFVKAMAKALEVSEEVTSPTFVIMKIYNIEHRRWKRLIHIDAYRLEDRKELDVLEFDRLISDPENLIFIEWPEHVKLAGSDLDVSLQLEMREHGPRISIEP